VPVVAAAPVVPPPAVVPPPPAVPPDPVPPQEIASRASANGAALREICRMRELGWCKRASFKR